MCGKPRFKVGDRVRFASHSGKKYKGLTGKTGVVVKPGPRDSVWDLRVRFDGETRSRAIDEGYFTYEGGLN